MREEEYQKENKKKKKKREVKCGSPSPPWERGGGGGGGGAEEGQDERSMEKMEKGGWVGLMTEANWIEGDLEDPTHFAQGEAQPFCVRVSVRCSV